MTPSPGWPCCKGWNDFLEAEPHHHFCDCSAPNRQRTSGTLMPLCDGQHTQHWKRFNGGCVRMNDFWRTWMMSQPDRAQDARGGARVVDTREDPHPCRQDPHVEQVQSHAGGRVAGSDSTRQHRSGGLLSPRGSKGSKFWGVLGHADFVTTQLEAIVRKHQVVAGYSQRQGCAVGLVAVPSLRRNSSQLPLARRQARFAGCLQRRLNPEAWMSVTSFDPCFGCSGTPRSVSQAFICATREEEATITLRKQARKQRQSSR